MRMLALMLLVGFGFMFLAQIQAQSTAPAGSGSDRANEVLFFGDSQVAESFQSGGTLTASSNYKVMTAKRDAPGEVEVHTKYTDVFYVVAGSATIVVGGQLQGQKSSDPEEPRGTSIQGGQVRHLTAGDVLVIPAGIPHWMNSVDPPFKYFVVKVASAM